MTTPELALLIVAGGIGAGLRFLVDRAVSGARSAQAFPVGILLVNVSGSFALGLIAGLGDLVPEPWLSALGIGLLGGFTTFSTVSVDSARFAREGRRDWAWLNLLGTFGACIVAASTGLVLGGIRLG
ncbi:CrcB family protein [Microbacterium sp. 179-B 1A2 NHS]|jgi:fluoride exporter|uniref:fluoride efflux transporter FluC n=1 Tax=Microbacterium sp. 179-B 1A2 NHS TaxID=3142383 RepID=UPI0039A082C8